MKSGKEDFESGNEATQRGFKVVCSYRFHRIVLRHRAGHTACLDQYQ